MQPREIHQVGKEKIRVLWDDGHESTYPFPYLRRNCPCALCVDEWTGRKLIDPKSVPGELQAEKAELVGNYAIAFQFTDGHSTGVYSFERMRGLCPCPRCLKSGPEDRP